MYKPAISTTFLLLLLAATISSQTAKEYALHVKGNILASAWFPQVVIFAPPSSILVVKVTEVIKGEDSSPYVLAFSSAGKKPRKYRANDSVEFKLRRAKFCDSTIDRLRNWRLTSEGTDSLGWRLTMAKGAEPSALPAGELPCYFAYWLPSGKEK